MTEDGTATHGADYEPAEGTLIFYPMETHKQIQVKIIDDEIFEEGMQNRFFYIYLIIFLTKSSLICHLR